MKKIIQENHIKNIALIIILLLLYFPIQNFVAHSTTINNALGNLLIVVSIIAVTACFGNFAFTYEKINTKKFGLRLLGHATTALLMLVLGISLEMTAIFSSLLIGNFVILNLCLFLLYVSAILYDYWDLYRLA